SLGHERVDVLGVSWGGVTATRLVLRHPELVASVVIADSSVGSGTTPERAAAMRGRATAVDELGVEEFARSRAPVLFSDGADPALVAEAAQFMVDSVRLPSYQWACNAMGDTDHRDALGGITTPTLVVYGDQDGVTPPSLSKQLAEGIPGAELVEIADAGHLANQERPEQFNDVVYEFLSRRSPLSSSA
ncbi:MAG: alpha/beta fold hydrolase, partial [Actinomycetota bacterium]|nr:alpha/beta fold hydrolase [Actinomycetota bacterium]